MDYHQDNEDKTLSEIDLLNYILRLNEKLIRNQGIFFLGLIYHYCIKSLKLESQIILNLKTNF